MPAASNNSKCMSIDVLAGRLLWVMIALALFGGVEGWRSLRKKREP